MFLSLDGTFWIQIVNFFIFYAILNAVFIKPAAEALRKRREYLDSLQAEFEEVQREVQELVGRAEAKRSEARRDGEQHAAALRAEAQRKADENLAQAQAQAVEIVEKAHREVEEELKAVRLIEDSLVGELSETMLLQAIGSI